MSVNVEDVTLKSGRVFFLKKAIIEVDLFRNNIASKILRCFCDQVINRLGIVFKSKDLNFSISITGNGIRFRLNPEIDTDAGQNQVLLLGSPCCT